MNLRLPLFVAAGAVGLSMMAAEPVISRFAPIEAPVRNHAKVLDLRQRQVSAAAPQKVAPLKAPDDGKPYTVIVEEDFSLCTAGSDIDPDPTFINTPEFMIPSSYTHTPGWGGRAIMQAGGAICIGKYEDSMAGLMTGQIETPELDLHRNNGKAYISFRAKSMPDQFDMITVRWVAETDFLPIQGEEQTFAVNGFGWNNYEVLLTDCPSNAVIQIYPEKSELFVDDIKVEQFQPEIEAPDAEKWTDFTGDSFVAHWTAIENADHYLFNCYYVRRQGTEDQLPNYKYVARDLEVAENSYKIENLDPTKTYYYYVRAVTASGVVSEESQVVEVMALTVPDGITVTDVAREGFTAMWNPVYNAEGYGFQAILDHKALAEEDYAILDENFDTVVNEGSIGTPYGNTIGYYDMDSYGISRANWMMYEGGVINGGLALHNYVSEYGTQYYGELVSPILSTKETTGQITIEADWATLDPGVKPYIQIAVPGEVDGKTQWVLGAGGPVNQAIGQDWTHVSTTYYITPGLTRISIGCTDGGWIYLDNLKITVHLPEGATQRLPYRYDEIKEGLEEPGYYCTTPDRVIGDSYSFAVMAARQRPGSYMIPVYVTSEWSELIQVPDFDWSGISDVKTDGDKASFTATTADGTVSILNPMEEALSVIDIAGHTIGRTSAATASFTLRPGVYIVAAVGGKAVKILVK